VQKLLLLSVIIATFAIPLLLERRTGGRTSFAAVLGTFVVFVGLYVMGLIYVYPRLS
jgi:hypothetical protein